jgi:hypothetical protein
MPSRSGNSEVVAIMERFRAHAALVRHLAAHSEDFRELCEHLELARKALSDFEAMPDAASRAEIADYHSVIESLENDIESMILAAVVPPPARR